MELRLSSPFGAALLALGLWTAFAGPAAAQVRSVRLGIALNCPYGLAL